MWHGFKTSFVLFFLLFPAALKGQQVQGVVYNLKQNWIQYDEDAQSFMPAISQSSSSTISFLVDGEQFAEYRLYINNNKEAHLFYKNILLASLTPGAHFFRIDSLLEITKNANPQLSLYGDDVKNNLSSLIINDSFQGILISTEKEHLKNKSYNSFFIISSILLLIGLIIIRNNAYDLFSQYANVSRAFNLTTIEEAIYKGGFFVNPSIQIITWMSFSAGFILYFLMAQLNIYFLQISWVSEFTLFFHVIHLLILAIGFFVLFLIRYLLIATTAYIFDMTSVINIHFATILRLTFYFLLLLQVIITLKFFSVFPIGSFYIFAIAFSSLLLIIILVGMRLSFIVKHSFVQLFLYLCGTEIFLFVFVFKLVVG